MSETESSLSRFAANAAEVQSYEVGLKVKAADKQEVTLEEVIAEMYACETLDAVKACWSKYPQFKSDDNFKRACTEQGIKTQNA